MCVLQSEGETAGSDDDAVDNNAIPGTPPSKKVCVRGFFIVQCIAVFTVLAK